MECAEIRFGAKGSVGALLSSGVYYARRGWGSRHSSMINRWTLKL